MMQQPVMTPLDVDMELAQLETQADQLEALQEAQAAGQMMPQMMQQGRPLEFYLLAGAVVAAGLYLFNKSYKLDIQKRPDNIGRIDELLDAKTVKSSTKKVKPD